MSRCHTRSVEDAFCRGPVDGLVEGQIGVQVRSGEVLNDGGMPSVKTINRPREDTTLHVQISSRDSS